LLPPLLALATLAGCAAPPAPTATRSLMIVGNDEKVSWNDTGAPALAPQGRDTLSVIDIGSDPLAPRRSICRSSAASSGHRSTSRSRPTRASRWSPTP
jgi:hypothetical protein